MTGEQDGWAELAWSQLWQVTLVAIVVGLLAWRAGRKRPHLAYLLWMLILLKCLTPPVWCSTAGLFSWLCVRVEAAPGGIGQPIARGVGETYPSSATQSDGAPISSVSLVSVRHSSPRVSLALGMKEFLLLAWGTGAGLLAIGAAAGKVRYALALRRSGRPGNGELQNLLRGTSRRIGVRRTVRLIVTSEPLGPAVYGVLRPTLVLPEMLLAGANAKRIEGFLGHELTHVRRGDIGLGLLQLLAQILWWFHPLVWWASREASRQRERCCDQESLAALGCDPAIYAQNLLDVLKLGRHLSTAPGLPGVRPAQVTLQRLEEIMNAEHGFQRRTPRWCWAVVLLAAALVLPGKGIVLGAAADDSPGAKANQAASRSPETEKPPVAAKPLGNSERTSTPISKFTIDDYATQWSLEGKPVTDDDLLTLENASHLRFLNLSKTEITDKGLIHLKRLSRLESLVLEGTRVTGAGFRQLQHLTSLRSLRLGNASVTDDGLAAIQGLTGLNSLEISDTQITDAGLAHLTKMPNLSSLAVGGRHVTIDGVVSLRSLASLRSVHLRHMPLSDADLPTLQGLFANLRVLFLTETRLTNAGARDLRRLAGLEVLAIHGAQITDAGLAELSSLANLRTLSLHDNRITGPGLAQLRRLRHLEILNLRRNPLHDEGLRHFRSPPRLKHLYLPDSVTPAGAAHIFQDHPTISADMKDGSWVAGWFRPIPTTDAQLEKIAQGGNTFTALRLADSDVAASYVSDKGLAHLKGLTRLKRLDLPGGITDAGMESLQGLHDLEEIHIDLEDPYSAIGRITGAGLAYLAGAGNLRSVYLNHAADAHVVQLAKFPKLERLYLGGKAITNDGLARIAGMTQLKYLSVHAGRADDHGLASLNTLTGLKRLAVFGDRISGSGLERLTALANLEDLEFGVVTLRRPPIPSLKALRHLKRLVLLQFAPASDADIAQIEEMTRLEELTILPTRITDTGLMRLKNLPQLKRIMLSSPNVTTAGVGRLRETLPAAKIEITICQLDDAGRE